jgi:hypothetical protein
MYGDESLRGRFSRGLLGDGKIRLGALGFQEPHGDPNKASHNEAQMVKRSATYDLVGSFVIPRRRWRRKESGLRRPYVALISSA